MWKGKREGGLIHCAYFLFGMSTGTRPLCNYILASLIVCGKGEGDTGESSTKINTNNELCLTPVGSFDLGGIAILWGSTGRHGETHALLRLLHAIRRRRVHLLRNTRLILLLHIGWQWGRMLGELLTRNHGTRWPVLLGRVTWRAIQLGRRLLRMRL